MPSLTYLTGFEHGAALVGGVGNGLAISLDSAANCFVEAGAARSGGFGLRMTNAAGRAQIHNPNSNRHVASFAWRATATPSAGTSDIWTCELPTFFMQIRYNQSTGKIEAALDEATFTPAASGVVLNQWYLVEFSIDSSGTTHSLTWTIDGILQTGVTRGGASNETISRSEPTCNGANACTWNFDDIALSETPADFPIGRVAILGATADQTAAAAHQGIDPAELRYTDNFSTFTNFTGASETDSRSRLDDLNTTDGVQMVGAITAYPTFRAAGIKSEGLTSATTVAAPAGVATGDLEILIATTDIAGTVSITTAGGSAWTAIAGTPVTVTAGETLYVWWRIRQAGDSDPQVTATADHVCAGRLAYTAGTFDATTPIEIPTTGTETASDTSFSWAPGTSTTMPFEIVMVIATSGFDSATGQVPVASNALMASVNLRANYNTANGGGGGFGATEGQKLAAGGIGTFACTYVTASPKAYLSFGIRPATRGGALTGNARWPVADPALGGIPVAVSCIFVARESAAGTNNITFRTLVGASTTNHFNADPGWGTTWNYVRSTMALTPASTPWTQNDVNGINFEADSTDLNPEVWLSGFFYEIAYTTMTLEPTIPMVVPNAAAQRAANW